MKNSTIALIIFLASFLYLLTFYNYGINLYDEGTLVNGALRILQGEIVYRDFFDYAPGRLFFSAFLFKIFGVNLHVIRIAMVFLGAIMVMLIFLIAKRIMPTLFAVFAAIFLVSGIGWYYTRFFIFFVLLNLLVICKYIEQKSRLWLLTSALVTVTTAFFRQDLGIYVIITASLTILIRNIYPFCAGDAANMKTKVKLRDASKEILIYALMAGIIALPIFSYFFFHIFQNNLSSIYFSLNSYCQMSLPFPKIFPFDNVVILFERSLFYFPIIIYLATVILLLYRWVSMKVQQVDLYLALFLIFGILTYFRTIVRTDIVHLLQSLPPVYILCCYFLFLLYRRKRVFIIFSFFMPIAFITNINLFYSGDITGSIEVLKGKHSLLDFNRAKIYCNLATAEIIKTIVNYIKTHTYPDDNIFVVPFNPMWYFLCERRNATYYDRVLPEIVNDDMQRRVIRELDKSQVKYIIYQDWLKDGREDRRFKNYAQLIENYIRNNYYMEKKVDCYEILRRKE